MNFYSDSSPTPPTIQPWVMELKKGFTGLLKNLNNLSSEQLETFNYYGEDFKNAIRAQIEKMTPLQLKIAHESLDVIQRVSLGMGQTYPSHESFMQPTEISSNFESTVSHESEFQFVEREETREQIPFMDKLIGLLQSSERDNSVEMMATNIVNYRAGGERATKADLNDFEETTRTMSMDLLSDIFQAIVVIHETTRHFAEHPIQYPRTSSDLNIFRNSLLRNKNYLTNLVKEEVKSTELSWAQKRAPNMLKHYVESPEQKLRKELNEKLKNISKQRLYIVADAVRILKKNHEFHPQPLNYSTGLPEAGMPRRPALPTYVPPVYVADSESFKDFLSELDGKNDNTPAPAPPPVPMEIQLPQKSKEEKEREEKARLEEEEHRRKERLAFEKQLSAQKKAAEEKFEKELNDQKYRNDQKETQMKVETEVLNEKASMEFEKEVKRQAKQHEENLRKAREEIEAFERETQRLVEERIKEWNMWNKAFLACIHMQQLFEEKEREWSNWLDALKSSIANAKTRFKLFEKIQRNINESQKSYGAIIQNELISLHKVTLTSYDMIFEACGTVKKLHDKFPERNFLHILLSKLASVSDQLCSTLEIIDACKEQKQSIDRIRASFANLSPMEIPTTSKLRIESKNETSWGEQEIKEPRVYHIPSFVTFEEVA